MGKILITVILIAAGGFIHIFNGLPDAEAMNQLKLMSASQVYDLHGGLIAKLLGDLLKKLPSSASSHRYIVMEEVKETLYITLD